MHCDIRDIENIIKGRINFYSYLAKDLEALESGEISSDEAAEALHYLHKETGFLIPSHPVERSRNLTGLIGHCREMMEYYLRFKICLSHADKDIGIMSLYLFLEAVLEEAHARKVAGIVDINDADQMKQLRSALLPYLPQVYQDLRKGIVINVIDETWNINLSYDTARFMAPLRNKTQELDKEFRRFTDRMPPNTVLNQELFDSMHAARSIEELYKAPINQELASQNNPTQYKSQFIIAYFTRASAKWNAYHRWYTALQQNFRELRKIKSQEQLQKTVIAAKESIKNQANECIESISMCLLDLENSHRKLSIEDHLEIRTRLESLFNQLQETQNRTVADLNDASTLADAQSALNKLERKLNKTSDFIIQTNDIIKQNQIKILEEKKKSELLRQQRQEAKEELIKESNLKYLSAFKAEQAGKLLLRKAEIAANHEKKRLQRSTLFATSTSTTMQDERPATTMAVNQVMYERLINLHEKHLDLIISILQASDGIAYRDVVRLIKNQLAGDIIEHGSSHKTIIIDRLSVQMYTNENNQLVAVSETLTAGMAKPHNPGHTEHHLSKWNIKLVRNALVAAGITLSAIEEIIATQEQNRFNPSPLDI